MKEQYNIIVLRTIRYNDRHNILQAYSRQAGPVAFVTPAGNGREASRRRALLQPLALIDCVGQRQAGRDLLLLHEPQAAAPLPSLRTNPLKASVAIFLAEVLGAVLREGAPDPLLFDFLRAAIEALEQAPARAVANFHLWFLYSLGQQLGIAPDTAGYRPGMVFDMTDGRFRQTPPLHNRYLPQADSAAVAALARMSLRTLPLFSMSRLERNRLLDGILEYYSIHYAALSSLRSLDILRSLF